MPGHLKDNLVFFFPIIQLKYMGVDIQRKKLKWNIRLPEQVS